MDRQQWHESVAFGAYRLVPRERTLYRDGVPVPLAGRPFDLLVALVERAGTVVSKDELIALVWPRTVVEEGNLRVHVGALRKALGAERHYVENVAGRGYSFVAPVRGEVAPPAVPVADAGPRLVGRDDVLAQLAAELPQRRLLTIAGPGGMGKTSVALALAARSAARFGARVYRADLAPLTDARLLPGMVAAAVGVPSPAQLAEALRPAPALLVLDGCEHLLSAAAALADRLLGSVAGLHIVATSREPLRVDGERVVRLAPLSLPADAAATPDSLAASAAARLFVDRAAAEGGFVLAADNADAVATICRRLDGIPLALELAAGRVAFFGVHELARRLGDSFAVLTRGRRTALPRHQTLRAALDWSHALLAPAEQAVLRRLAVFRGTFAPAAAAAVAQGGGIGAQAVQDHVAQLVAKSLVVAEPARYRLLDTTRAYARERLREAGEEWAVAQRCAQYWCALLGQAGQDDVALPPPDAAGIDDVRAALDWAFAPGGDPVLGARLAAASAPLWYRLSLMDEYRVRLAPALACAAGGAGGPALAMTLHLALGHTLLHAADAPRAVRTQAFGQALALAERIGDRAAIARALWGCYADALFGGDYAHALALARRFGTLAGDEEQSRIAYRRLLARALHYLGDQHGASVHAHAVMHPARGRPGGSGFQFDQRVSSLALHGRLSWLQGRSAQALQAARVAVDEAARLDHRVSLCFALVLAVPVALWCGDLPLARSYLALMEERARHDSLAQWQFWARMFRAAVRLHDGVPAEPADVLVTDPRCTGLHLDVLPTLHPALLTHASLARAADGRAGWAAPELLRCWGESLVRVGACEQAERVFRQSLSLAQEQGALAWELRAATSLARILALRGREGGRDALLRSVLDRYPEGRDTHDVAVARACIVHDRALDTM